jgi:hypothetical protein
MTASATFAVTADGRRQRIILGAEINRGGASGRVIAIDGDRRSLAKLYHDLADAAAARDRLAAMLARPPNLKPPQLNGVEHVQLAWPDALIEDGARTLLGFRMPRVPLNRAVPLECLLNPVQRRAEKLPEDYGLRVFAAANLAGVLAELHRLGHHVIDLKPLNVYVYRATMFVALLDCDGYSIAGPDRRFPASHFSDEYRGPESATRGPQELGEEQDLFALAVIAFQLLNDGIHPFDGHPAPGASIPSGLQQKINAGLYPYGARPGCPLLPHALSLHARLEDDTRRLFDRALSGLAGRPSAAEWRDHLRGLIERNLLVRCARNPDHAHFSKGCGLCAKESAIRAATATAASRPAAAPKPRRRGAAAAALGRRLFRPAPASAAARPAPAAMSAAPVAAPAKAPATSTGAARALARALVAAIQAGVVGGLAGLALAVGGLPLPTPWLAFVLALVLVLAIGCWIDDRRGGGHRGLVAALVAVVPTSITLPLLYTAASPLPPPVALAVTAMVASLVPAFAFGYLRRSRRRGPRWQSFSARRWAAGLAGMGLLVACQMAAVAGLNLPEANPQTERLALPQVVVAAIEKAKQSLREMADRVRRHSDQNRETW